MRPGGTQRARGRPAARCIGDDPAALRRATAPSSASAPPAGPAGLGAIAPALFVVLWSTGFVGAKYVLPDTEPFTFLLVRLALAGALLAAVAAATRSAWPASPAAWRHAAVAGLLLHAGYLGGVFWAISRGVPAGVSAVVVSLQPVLTAVLALRLLGERVGRRVWLGLLLGLAGVALVVLPGVLGDAGAVALPAAGVGACLVALASGTAGALYQKRHGDDVPLLAGTAVQYAACTAAFAVLAPASERLRVDVTTELVLGMAWLVLALSVGAILLLLTLLRRGSATRVTSLYYLVPPATALEAWLVLDERLGAVELAGMLVAVAGVALVLAAPAGPR